MRVAWKGLEENNGKLTTKEDKGPSYCIPKRGAFNQAASSCSQNNQSIKKKLWPSFNVILSLHYPFNIFDNPNVLFVIKKHKLYFVNMSYKILGQQSRSQKGMRKTWRSTILHLVIQVVIKKQTIYNILLSW